MARGATVWLTGLPAAGKTTIGDAVAEGLDERGYAIVSLISPYRSARDQARELHARAELPFLEVYLDTPLAECERRDPRGLYAPARRGEITGFTGVDDPYEPPLAPEVVIDTSRLSIQECVDAIVNKLLALGYILPHGHIAE